MSSWHVLQVSVPTYKEASVARVYFNAASCFGFDLPDLFADLLLLSSAAAAAPHIATESNATIKSPARSRGTRARRKLMGLSFSRSTLNSPDQLQLSSS